MDIRASVSPTAKLRSGGSMYMENDGMVRFIEGSIITRQISHAKAQRDYFK